MTRPSQAQAAACLLVALLAGPALALVPTNCPQDSPVVSESEAELAQAVDRATTFPTALDGRVFDRPTEVVDGQMKPDVREAAIALVERNFQDMDLPPEWTIQAIDLQGSIVSYEWDELADLGIHVFLALNGSVCYTSCKAPEGPVCEGACLFEDYAKLYNDWIEVQQEAVIDDAQGKTYAEPLPSSGVLINGVVAEVTFLATRPPSQQPVEGTGMYSILQDQWVSRPTPQPNNFDRAEMLGNATRFVDQYNALLCEYEAAKAAALPDAPGSLDFDCKRWEEFVKALKAYRGTGFDAALGSRSTSNLVFRLLRRTSVNVVDQPDVWQQQCLNLKASLPGKKGAGARPAGAAAAAGAPDANAVAAVTAWGHARAPGCSLLLALLSACLCWALL